ncbi:hypothetical protein GCM10017608_04750 [Agromyces luteolus]|uniref:Uncharacterized protein n=1 Tax=Agromyces luteolus TaxID=88373 RepID=A0A7C9HJ64_9MICO|nr:hypothetical protein [Agromyces luteolus]MUN06422.1 hypothetical protein [Agromyces luteolus]GLK26543.1 hypothetical protein GCM10017608_04750 [Agromyces luteolus]
MRIGVPAIESDRGRVTWSVPVAGVPGAPTRLWFTVPGEHAALLTHLADPAVIGLLVPAMHAGAAMTVDGPVTDEVVFGLTHGYQHVMEAVIPELRPIGIEAGAQAAAREPAPGVATGFSAGIDSFAVVAEHLSPAIPDELRLTHLVFFNVGAMTGGAAGRRRFERMRTRLAPSAERLGLPFVPVDSNLDDFFPFAGFVQTHGPRNLSAASLLQGGIGRFLYASTHPFARVSVGRSHSTAYSDPISMPLLETTAFRPRFHGSRYTRAEKTTIVAGLGESHQSLHVCTTLTADGSNCSRCSKCLRTQLTLELIGQLGSYGRVFDLEVYEQLRRGFLDEVAHSRDPHLVELREFARETGFRLPPAGAGFLRHGLRRLERKSGVLRGRLAGG